MNNPSSRPDDPRDGLEAEAQLREDLEALHRLPVPSLRFDPLSAHVPARTPALRRGWRPALVAASAAAALALFVGGPSLLGGSPQEVSAQEVFQRTKDVAAASFATLSDDSYHLVATTDSTGSGAAANSETVTETWYGDAEHQRTETRDAESGEVLFGHIRNGDDVWMYAHVDGVLKAVHSYVEGGTFAFGIAGVPLTPGVTDLSELLGAYNNDCSEAKNLGEEVVAGRPVYVIEVVSKPETCTWEAITIEPVKGDAGEGGGVASAGGVSVAGEAAVHVEGVAEGGEPAGPMTVHASSVDGSGGVKTVIVSSGPMKMWIDQETFMTLKSESSFGEDFRHSYEVLTYESGIDLPGEVFSPPAEAEIVEGDSPEGAAQLFKGMFQFGAVETREFKVEAIPNSQ